MKILFKFNDDSRERRTEEEATHNEIIIKKNYLESGCCGFSFCLLKFNKEFILFQSEVLCHHPTSTMEDVFNMPE